MLLESYELDLASRCYLTAVYCSHHNKEQLKATKHKANRQLMRFAGRTKAMVLPDDKVDQVAITKQSKHC